MVVFRVVALLARVHHLLASVATITVVAAVTGLFVVVVLGDHFMLNVHDLTTAPFPAAVATTTAAAVLSTAVTASYRSGDVLAWTMTTRRSEGDWAWSRISLDDDPRIFCMACLRNTRVGDACNGVVVLG